MGRTEIVAGLRAMQEVCPPKMPDEKSIERYAAELRRVYSKTVGIPESQVNVEVDIFNGIIRVSDALKPTVYFNMEEKT